MLTSNTHFFTSSEKGSLPSRTDDEGVKLLHEINSVQHQLKNLHKDEQGRAKKIKVINILNFLNILFLLILLNKIDPGFAI